jgi:murein DD-endopeptidase MepM/ murein hydrolase activator NlpD
LVLAYKYMKQRMKLCFGKFASFLKSALTTQSDEGSGLGVFLRSLLRKRHFSVRRAIGINLAGLAFFAAVIVPQTQNVISDLEVSMTPQRNVIVVDASPSLLQWPFRQFGISQEFSAVHPAMDLTNPLGTPIYPVGDGVVAWVRYLSYGYGSHVLIIHPDGLESLYAHMNVIYVHEGQNVTKTTKIGEVGLTGWTTGPHLHLEVYENSMPTNPMEVLPEIKDIQ